MKTTYSLLALIFSLPSVALQKSYSNTSKAGLHDILLKMGHDTASYLGFGIKCRNGGRKTEDNSCICLEYFTGKECEKKVCINGGRLEKVIVPTVNHVCKCPYPAFITGEHCEKIKCANSGTLKTFPNGTQQCDCATSQLYGGMFCEKFLLSSGWVMAFIGLGLLLIVAFICSSNWFSKNRKHARRTTCPSNREHGAPSIGGRRVATHHRSAAHRSSSADDLISSERADHRRTTAYPEGLTQQYVVRLDTIPTFNPAMIGGVEPMVNLREQTEFGPPPSYDQAMSSNCVEPPRYTAKLS
uniref:EGF-like domain-containing protein n=1 Tax=Caenorhabditis japonica TaxID=281687 RepID=A0A8R1E004_CAEJA